MKLSKKILSIVLSALMVISMLPMTALAATTLTKETNTANSTYASVVLYNGVDYIAYAYSGFTPITGDSNNAIGEITINKGQSLSFNNGCSQMNGNRSTPATLGWHWGAKASWGGTYYCIATDKAFEGTCSDTSVSVGMSGFGSTTVDNDVIGPNANADATTSYVTTAFNNVGTYYITISYKYQMKSKRFSYSTQNEISSSDVLKVNVVCPHSNGSKSANNAVAPTCEKDGKESDLVCNDCGATTATGSTLQATGHNYGAWTSLNDATNHYRYCSNDNTHYESQAHTWGTPVRTTTETCSTKGVDTYTCTVCGQTKTEDVDPTGVHTFTNYVSDNNATCFANGTKTATCDVCKVAQNTVTDEGTQLTHSYTNYVYNNDAKVGVDGTETAACDNGCSTTDTRTKAGTALAGPQNSASLTLEDTVNANLMLDVNYYVDEANKGVAEEDKITAEDVTIDLTYDTSVSAETTTVETVTGYTTKTVNGKLMVTVESAPAKLSQDITLSMKANGEELFSKTYSMEDVCEATIAAYDESSDPAEKASAEVCKTLINYANAAQVYFNYNTVNMAGTKYVVDTDASTVNYGVAQSESDVKATGMTFVALANAEARLYLEKSEAEFYAATGYMYGDLELEVSGVEDINAYFGKANGRVFIGVTGIKAAYLDDDITVTVKKDGAVVQEITFTAVTYAVAGVQSSKESLKNLSQAIINYNAKANDLLAANA